LNKVFKFALMSAIAIAVTAVTAVPLFAGATVAVPEPTSLVLLASAIGGVVVLRRLRK
jgi:predicted secreted protein